MRDSELSEDEARLLHRLQEQTHLPISEALIIEGISEARWRRIQLRWYAKEWWDGEQLTTLGMRQG